MGQSNNNQVEKGSGMTHDEGAVANTNTNTDNSQVEKSVITHDEGAVANTNTNTDNSQKEKLRDDSR